MGKIKKTLIGLVLIIILVLIFLPTITKNYAINNSKELIGRKIDIGKLKYNYFSSTVKVYDFKMYESNDKDEFTTLDTLIINLEPLQLFKDKIEIEQLYIKGLMVKTVMKDSTFNFDDLLAFHSQPDDSINTKDPEPFKYSISDIELKDSNFSFDDKNVDKETLIEDLSFMIPHIGWDQKEKSNADVKFHFKNGGYFQSAINVNPVDGEFDAVITIKDLYLNPFYEYVAEYAKINDFNGLLNSQIKIEGNTNEAIKSIVTGTVSVNDFEMVDTSGKTFMSAKHINTEIQSIDYYNSNYELASVTIDDSYTYFQLDSLSNNFFRIFKLDDINVENTPETSAVVSDTIQSQTENALNYAINKLTLNNGILDYTDNLTGQPFNYNLSEIEIDSDSITNTSEWIDIYTTMLLNERGTLKSELGIDPSNYLNSTLDIAIENFLLSDLNIYTNHYMGHSILKGDMYYFSKSKLTNGQIDSKNKLLVKNASLENSKGGLYDLPLKFAFFLLTDKNGDVNLDIPVKGDLNDPSTDIGAIVWKTFKNVIGKTVAAPINFLVGLVGGDPKELEELNFTYTDSILNPKHERQLSKLLDLERQKDSLKITMTYFVDSTLLTEALAAEYIGLQFNKDTGDDYLKNEKDFNAYVFKKVGNDSLNITIAIKQLTKGQPIDSLARTRREVVMKKVDSYLKLEYPITNIELKQGKPEALENSGAYPKFLITYGLMGEEEEEEPTKDTIAN
ncbi:DUF748 domain-containing protein [Psychroserpens jangbogonensis]|uniref:DUF748 domain-containing protein n=1 Tax=Psychroserpens jangbogonensis TaxID=1484460 RepID=UPI00053D7F70|nr:DUF748 domain-containing protein [Psychroserpens jangbogonensis]